MRIISSLKDGVEFSVQGVDICANGAEWLAYMFDREFDPQHPFEGYLQGYLIVKASISVDCTLSGTNKTMVLDMDYRLSRAGTSKEIRSQASKGLPSENKL